MATKKRRKARAASVTRLPGPGERVVVLALPFRTHAPGSLWDPALKVTTWVGRPGDLPGHLSGFVSRPYTLERMIEDSLNATPGTPYADPPVMAPRPLQIEGARAIARHAATGAPQFLLTDDVGCGKTLTSVVAAKAALRLRGGSRVLVIADRPAAITIDAWARTIAAAGDGGHTWCVITWDHLAKVSGLKWDVLVADEAQALRHPTTKRWGHWVRVSGANRASNHPYQILATATPGHTPLELPYLAPAFASATHTAVKTWTNDFPAALETHGIHLAKSRYGPEWTSDPKERAADLAQVQRWLTGGDRPATIHHEAPWGPVQLHGLPVTLDHAQHAAYEQEWAQFRADMNIARRGNDTAKGRARVLRFRQKAAMIRVDQTADWVAAQVDAGKQVAVSVQYVETAANPLVEALRARGVNPACLYGQPDDPERERLLFQTGRAPAIVFTPAAAINLHAKEPLARGKVASAAPRIGVFHQARYSGIQARQICGRTHRDHQTSPWYVLFGAGTVEQDVARIMVERIAAATDLTGGDTTLLTRIARLLHADWLPPAALADDDLSA